MTRLVVSGYACLDHVLTLAGKPCAGRTTLVRERPLDAWPRAGGCVWFVARAAMARGAKVQPLSWVGDDALGAQWLAQLRSAGLDTEGVEQRANQRTALSVLAYQDDGGCACLFDPGSSFGAELGSAQRALLAQADWACVTVGPPRATEQLLQALPPQTQLVWAVKADAASVSPTLARALAARAMLICHSRDEAGFVELAMQGLARQPWRVETRGVEGVVLHGSDGSMALPCKAVDAPDPTGAGDCLVGGLLAALMANPVDLRAAVQAGMASVQQMLMNRMQFVQSPLQSMLGQEET